MIKHISQLASENPWFRQELITGKFGQVVLMSIPSGDDIGFEKHEVDQILIIVEGMAEAIIGDDSATIKEGYLAFVPAGTLHNIKNIGKTDLKLYTVYCPPEHEKGTIHKTKAAALRSEEN